MLRRRFSHMPPEFGFWRIRLVSTVKTTGSVDLVLLEESNAAVSSVFSPVVWSCFNVKVVMPSAPVTP